MFNFSKLIVQTRNLMSLRHSAPIYNINFSTSSVYQKTAEERIGLPPRPKRPLTPYFRFLQEFRSQVSSENPKLTPLEVVQECAKRWAVYDEGKKQGLNSLYQKDKEQFLKDRLRYENTLTIEQKEQLGEFKQDLQDSREKRAYKKRVREMEKPKKPASGFLRFLSERYASGDRGPMNYREFQLKVAGEWKALTEDQKKIYIDAFVNDLKDYKRELAKWELKMIRLGHVELVRHEALIDNSPNEKKPKLVKSPGRPRGPKN